MPRTCHVTAEADAYIQGGGSKGAFEGVLGGIKGAFRGEQSEQGSQSAVPMGAAYVSARKCVNI